MISKDTQIRIENWANLSYAKMCISHAMEFSEGLVSDEKQEEMLALLNFFDESTHRMAEEIREARE